MIALTSTERMIVLEIIKDHVPDCEEMAFGSRINGQHKPYQLSPEFKKIIESNSIQLYPISPNGH